MKIDMKITPRGAAAGKVLVFRQHIARVVLYGQRYLHAEAAAAMSSRPVSVGKQLSL